MRPTAAIFAGRTYYFNGEDSLGLSYEREVRDDGTAQDKYYLSAGGLVFAMVNKRTSGQAVSHSSSYFHHDHLGSIAAITDETGAVKDRLAFDPWGKRRFVLTKAGWPDTKDEIVGLRTDRGYTMHEELDEVGAVHMNGRVYDPLIGRFMTADSIVPNPSALQSFNRYAYVFNNPLRYTDPDGHEPWPKAGGGNTSWVTTSSGAQYSSYSGLPSQDIKTVMINTFGPERPSYMSWTSSTREVVGNLWSSSTGSTIGSVVGNRYTDTILGRLLGDTFGVLGALIDPDSLNPLSRRVENFNAINRAVAIIGLGVNFVPGARAEASLAKELGLVAKGAEKIFYRSMSKAEADAVRETGKLRGGNPGETFFTDSRFRSADRAQDRLSLRNRPEVQMEFRLKNDLSLERGGTRVDPAYGGRGGGREYMTRNPVEVEIINVQPYR